MSKYVPPHKKNANTQSVNVSNRFDILNTDKNESNSFRNKTHRTKQTNEYGRYKNRRNDGYIEVSQLEDKIKLSQNKKFNVQEEDFPSLTNTSKNVNYNDANDVNNANKVNKAHTVCENKNDTKSTWTTVSTKVLENSIPKRRTTMQNEKEEKTYDDCNDYNDNDDYNDEIDLDSFHSEDYASDHEFDHEFDY